MREAEVGYLAKKGRERMSRKEKQELKELVQKRLRRELAPSVRHVDVSWSLEENAIRFFSQSVKPAAAMTDLFQKTFGLKLVPEAPYTLGVRLGAVKDRAWDELEPTLFAEEVA